MEIAKKITMVRESLGLNKKNFAAEIHISPSYVTEIEAGKKVPSDSLLDLIMEKWHVSVDWWETGEGAIFREEKEKAPSESLEGLTYQMVIDSIDRQPTGDDKLALVTDLREFLKHWKKN